MSATVMTVSAMPISGINVLLYPVSEPQKQAFILNKGLLLSDRTLSGRLFHTFSSFMTEDASRCVRVRFFAAKSKLGYRGFCLFKTYH